MKILVVDDEELLVKGIRFNLQNDGYQGLVHLLLQGPAGSPRPAAGRQAVTL